MAIVSVDVKIYMGDKPASKAGSFLVESLGELDDLLPQYLSDDVTSVEFIVTKTRE